MVAHGIILKYSKYAKVQSKVQQIRQGSILSTANTPRFNLKYSKYAKGSMMKQPSVIYLTVTYQTNIMMYTNLLVLHEQTHLY